MNRFQVSVDSELEPIMDRYMEIRQEQLAEFEAALKAEDSDTLRRLGHTLRGSGASYGLHQLTKLGSAIEKASKNRKLDDVKELVQAVRDFLDHVDIIYQK